MPPSLRWRIPFVIILTVAGLAVVFWGYRPWAPKGEDYGLRLGFDLKGGVELCYNIEGALTDEEIAKVRSKIVADNPTKTAKQIDLLVTEEVNRRKKDISTRTAETIRIVSRRLDPTGVKAPDIRSEEQGVIIIRLPGLTPDEVKSIKSRAGQMGRLEFREVVNDADYAKMGRDAKATVEKKKMRIRSKKHDKGEPDRFEELYIQTVDPYSITGGMLTRCYPTSDQVGAPAVGFEFNSEGAKLFGGFTGKLAGKGRLAILLNGELISAPSVNSKITDRGIIEGSFTETEVEEMVTVLQAGSLPASLTLASEIFVGPELGTDSRDRGYNACKFSFIIVVVFMAAYYLLAGGIADLALALNLLFLVAAMMMFDAVLTLPGIAGIVLTLGMAVDANVLIYERVREEQDQGQSLRQAVKNGYDRAFTTILDSHVTTFITGIVLYWLGTGAVRGFAVTLCIGIVLSFFTALFVTRIAFDVLIGKGWIKEHLTILRLIRKPKIRWIRLAPVFFTISGLAITAGMIVFFYRGRDNYGIDFSSGTSMHLRLKGLVVKPSDVTALPGGKESRLTLTFFQQKPGGALVDAQATAEVVQEGLVRLKADEPALDLRADVKLVWPEGKKSGSRVDLTVAEPAGGTAVGKQLAAAIQKYGFKDFRLRMDIEDVRAMVAKAGYRDANVQTAFGDQAIVGRRDSDQFTIRVQGKSDKETQEEREAIPTNIEHEFRSLVDYKSVDAKVHVEAIPATDNTSAKLDRVTLQFVQFDPADNKTMPIRLRKDHIMQDLTEMGYGSAVFHWPAEGREYEEVVFDVPTGSKDKIEKQLSAKEAFTFPDAFTGYYFVNPGQAQHIVRSAQLASILSFIGISLYVWLRFGAFKYGLAAVVSLIHDVLWTLGVLASLAWLAETPFGQRLGMGDLRLSLDVVAGVLTLIGYSINDTIVVFDRIRENLRRRIREMRGKRQTGDYLTPELIDESINQTMSRTIITSWTTWIVCVTLLFGAGQSLRGMSVCLVFGIIIGTFSSFAIACPILVLTHIWEARRAKATGGMTTEERDVAMEDTPVEPPK